MVAYNSGIALYKDDWLSSIDQHLKRDRSWPLSRIY